jgi:hypothetical protein
LGQGVEATKTFANTSSVLYDGVYVPGGADSVTALIHKGDARVFIDEAYKHANPIGAIAEGVELLTASEIGKLLRISGSAAATTTPTAKDGVARTPVVTSTAAISDRASPGTGVQNRSEVGHVLSISRAHADDLAKIGVIIGQSGQGTLVKRFLDALAHHRFWGRERQEQVSA